MIRWALVPIKPFSDSKTRLRSILTDVERYEISRTLFQNTMRVLNQIKSIQGIAVVSVERAESAACGEIHSPVTWIIERNPQGLNAALHQATLELQADGVEEIMILPADLPLLTREAVNALIDCRSSVPDGVIITPDHRRDGTNALVVSPPGAIPYFFGPHSFARHVMYAQKKGLNLTIFENEALSFDLDLPDDLFMIKKAMPNSVFATQ